VGEEPPEGFNDKPPEADHTEPGEAAAFTKRGQELNPVFHLSALQPT
jgi:hypothetical protein